MPLDEALSRKICEGEVRVSTPTNTKEAGKQWIAPVQHSQAQAVDCAGAALAGVRPPVGDAPPADPPRSALDGEAGVGSSLVRSRAPRAAGRHAERRLQEDGDERRGDAPPAGRGGRQQGRRRGCGGERATGWILRPSLCAALRSAAAERYVRAARPSCSGTDMARRCVCVLAAYGWHHHEGSLHTPREGCLWLSLSVSYSFEHSDARTPT